MKVCELRNILNEYDGETEVVFSDGDGNDYDFNGTTIRIKEELELSNEKDLKEKFTVICNHCGGKNIIIEQEFEKPDICECECKEFK